MSFLTLLTMRRICSALLLWLMAVSCACAQSLPPAPADGVFDDTRALSQESHQLLAEEIRAFRETHGMDAWFAAITYIRDGQTMRSEARLLRQAWSGPRPALLMLYDRSRNQEIVSFAPWLWDVLPTADLFHAREQVHNLMADTTKPPEQRLRESMRTLIRTVGMSHINELRTNQLFTQDYKHMLRWAAIILVSGAVFAGMAGILARRRDQRAARVSFMPAIQVPPRLGAAHGGGTSIAWTGQK